MSTQETPPGSGSAPTPLEPLISALRSVATGLLQDLEGAAEALQKEGQLPKESLSESIHSLRDSYRTVWSTLEQHAAKVGIELETPGDDLSLSSLEEIWQQIDSRHAEARHLLGVTAPPDVVERYVYPELEKGKKVVFIVIDCMRLDQWLALEKYFYDYYTIDKDYYYSILRSQYVLC